MVFSSYLFLFYMLPLALVAYYAVPRRAKQLVLVLLSYIFYGWANPLFLFLLAGTTLVDYAAGLIIAKADGVLVGRDYVVDPEAPRSRTAKAALVALLPAVPPHGYRALRRAVQGSGDTALMLDLPPSQLLYPPESIWLRRVVEPDGRPWRSSPSADVLLLGDSFTNIYSLASMRWGSSAGFAEQLSFELQRPIDRIVQNDEGAAATRAIVQRRLGGRADPLAGKRVVIHQFAARELAFGDWRLTPLDGAPQGPERTEPRHRRNPPGEEARADRLRP